MPDLLESGNSAALIAIAKQCGALEPAAADRLAAAHTGLLKRALDCTLDMRPRLAPRDAALQSLASGVLEVAASLGLDFAASVAR
jgi:glutamate-ammonia-ligase adenylyltransferase